MVCDGKQKEHAASMAQSFAAAGSEGEHVVDTAVQAAVEKAMESPLYHDLSEKHRSLAAKEPLSQNCCLSGMPEVRD